MNRSIDHSRWVWRPEALGPRTRRITACLLTTAFLVGLFGLVGLTACSLNSRETDKPIQSGMASWYGPNFHGRTTANGERYDQHGLTAAHKELPFGTILEVVNLDNGRRVTVRINDRGPFVGRRIIDLSRGAADAIGMIGPGLAKVALYLVPTETGGTESGNDARAAVKRGAIRFTVQVGAFQDSDLAPRLRDRLLADHPQTEIRTNDGWHRVQIGYFKNRNGAEIMRRTLEESGIWSVVVRLKRTS